MRANSKSAHQRSAVWRKGRRPDVDTFATLLHWLNISADTFMVSADTDPAEEPDAMVMVSTYLRSAKNIERLMVKTSSTIGAQARAL